MKKVLLFGVLSLACFTLSAQTPTIEWQKSLGGSSYDFAQSIQQTIDGGYIFSGSVSSNDGDVTGNHGPPPSRDAWMVKLSQSGNIEWQNALGGSGADIFWSIDQTFDGGYVTAGWSSSNDGDVAVNRGSDDYWIVKLDSAGNIAWQKSFGGSEADRANSIQQTTDSGYIVAGESESNNGNVIGNHGSVDYWVVKLYPNGTMQWQKSLGGSGYEKANSIQQTSDGGYIVAGVSASNNGNVTGNHGMWDYWIVKLSAAGNIQWEKSLGGSQDEQAYSIRETYESGYIVAGNTDSNDGDVAINSGSDCWIVKLDTLGNIEWQKSLVGASQVKDIQQTSDSGYALVGNTFANDSVIMNYHGGMDYWVSKLNPQGNIEWQKALGGCCEDEAFSIQQVNDNGFIIAGFTTSNDGDVSNGRGQNDCWIVKLNAYTGVQEILNKSSFSLSPNPATTTVTISVDEEMIGGTVTLSDITGRKMAAAQLETPNTKLETANLVNGVYFVTVSNGKGNGTKKLIVNR